MSGFGIHCRGILAGVTPQQKGSERKLAAHEALAKPLASTLLECANKMPQWDRFISNGPYCCDMMVLLLLNIILRSSVTNVMQPAVRAFGTVSHFGRAGAM